MMEREHQEVGDALRLIRELTRGYTAPDGRLHDLRDRMAELQQFERDLHRHVHLENNVLFPGGAAARGPGLRILGGEPVMTAATLLFAAAVAASASPSFAPPGWDAGVKLAEARDTNPGSGDRRDRPDRARRRRRGRAGQDACTPGPTTAAFPGR